MSFEQSVFQRAVHQLEQDAADHRRKQEALRQKIGRLVPRVAQIEGEMRRISLKLCRATFDRRVNLAELDEQMSALRRERAAHLMEQGYEYDELDDTPLCRICDDTGWQPDGKGMCSCLRRRCVQEQMQELSNTLALGGQSFSAFRLDYYSSESDPNMGISPRQNMENVLDHCKAFARYFRPDGGNLLFSGGTGLGKTYLSACIAQEVSESEHSVVYDTAVNILRRFEQEKFRTDDSARDETRRYIGCDLLIMDDLGCEALGPYSMTFLYDLLNTRLVNQKATVISTNLSPVELKKRYSPQIFSRLMGECRVHPFFGEDIRLLKKRV